MRLSTPRVVVIGGGFGGIAVAKRLVRSPARVTVVDRCNHHLFQPLLYQVATAGLGAESIAQPIRHVVRRSDHDVVYDEVVDVDLDQRRVSLASGEPIAYDVLVLAAGAATDWFGHDEWAESAFALKTTADAVAMRERLLWCFEVADRERDEARRRELLTFVVVGGGPTGVELAGAFAELGRRVLSREFKRVEPDDVRVILAEMASGLLRGFERTLGDRAHRDLEARGVDVRLETKLEDLSPDGVAHLVGPEREEERLRTGAVCWTSGVKPVPLSERIDSPKRGGKLEVDRFCSLPGHPEVFCIGDMAHFEDDDGEALPGLAAVAKQQGEFVGETIRRDLGGRKRKPFEYADRGLMATVGKSSAVVQLGGVKLHGFIGWLVWGGVHILLLTGLRNRTMVFLDWLWQLVSDRRGARVLTRRASFERNDEENEKSRSRTHRVA